MLEAIAGALEATALSQTLRSSVWLYPLVNTGHVIGIALLFGGIAPLDLRLIGCWRAVAVAPLVRILVPMAMSGLILAALTGALLFATRPLDYVNEPLFGIKMALLIAAVLNALALRRSPRWGWIDFKSGDVVRPAWKVAAVLSLVLWLGVIIAGRLIGYR
ncbi:MAG: hypothetical protein ACKVQT_28595 [Burkholderiales bacterium]